MPVEQPSHRPGGRIVIVEPTARRGRVLIVTLAVLAAVVVGFVLFTSFWTDLLWYRSVDASGVFTTQLWTRIGLFLGFGALMAVLIAVNAWLPYRFRPALHSMTAEQASLERYRISLEPLRRVLLVVIPGVLGVLAGVSASSEWQTWLLWRNATDFGTTDPEFGMDVAFYAFTLPFLRFVIGFLFAALVLSFVVAVVVHYLYGGLRLQSPEGRTSPAARAHLSTLIGVFVLLKAAAYALDRYDLATSQSGLVPGLTYTDEHAVLPAQTIMIFVALICAVLFFVCAFRDSWRLAITSLVLLLGTSVLIGGIYPALVQQLQVRPTEVDKESPYITRSIQATRDAYDIADAEITPYQAVSEATSAALTASAGTIDAVRLIDPTVVGPTFAALEQNRTYYTFPDTLDVDRYRLNGQLRGSTVAVRELNLNGIPDAQRNWANDHVIYTHGFGFVSAFDNTATTDGKPQFFEAGLPGSGPLDIQQPRIYFGEYSPQYSIVGAPAGTPPRELDYPDESAEQGIAKYTYEGAGGIPVGNLLNRLMYTVKYQEPNILLSDLVNEDSRILEVRDPRDRVQKIAPWLRLDGDAYPAVVDGKIVWIIDGYTTTDRYPYSKATTLGDATSDSATTASRNLVAQARDDINYIRNSVKATVDAYDGTVTLYAWDEADPILQTWSKAFPGLVHPSSDISPALMSHLRYPADLFKVQRKILAQYHVTDANNFYYGTDFWSIPDDPAKRVAQPQPPYYLQVQMPGEDGPVFSLTTTFAPQRRPTLAAFMAVNSEPGPNYGKMELLQLPSNTTIPGPAQVQNNFETDPTVKQQLTLLRGSGSSDIDYGNLLSLPVAGGVLYVEPVYIRAGGADGYPLLKRVLVGFGAQVAFEDTLGQALEKLFGGKGGGSNEPDDNEPPPSQDAEQRLAQAIAAAQKALADGEAALTKGDWQAYGAAQKRLQDAIAKAVAAQQELAKQSPEPSAEPGAGDNGDGSPPATETAGPTA